MFFYPDNEGSLNHKLLTKEKKLKCEVTDMYCVRPRIVV